MLKSEIIKSLQGESSFPKDILSMMVSEAEKNVLYFRNSLKRPSLPTMRDKP